jgi:hypothetical protein
METENEKRHTLNIHRCLFLASIIGLCTHNWNVPICLVSVAGDILMQFHKLIKYYSFCV